MSDEKSQGDVASEVVERVEPLIKALPPEKQEEVRHIIETSVQYQGPLPPPSMMVEYNKVIPNGADRIMVLLEKQTDHRITVERQMVTEHISVAKRGQWFATGLSVFFGCIALFLGLEGKEVLAGSLGVSTIIGLAVVFVLGREPGATRRPSPSDDEKDEDEDVGREASPRKPTKQQPKRSRRG